MESVEKINQLFDTKAKQNIELALNILFGQLGIEVSAYTIETLCNEYFCFDTATLEIKDCLFIYKDTQSRTHDYYYRHFEITIPLKELNEDMLWHIYNWNWMDDNCSLPIKVYYNMKETKHGDDETQIIEFNNIIN